MTKTDTSDVRKLSDSEIKEQVDGLRRELFDLRFQRATRQLTETQRFKQARIKLAQLLTVKQERASSNTSS